MGDEDKPKDTPGVDDKGGKEDKPKVNVGPDGQPLKFGDEGYLIGGKYKDVEAVEKALLEGEQKITELGQAKGERDKAITEMMQRASEARKVTGEEEKTKSEERRKVLAAELGAAWDKSPLEALAFMEKLIEEKQTGGGFMKRADYDKKLTDDETASKEYNRVRGTGDPEKKEQQKEFDALKPVMNELWGKLPKEAKVPSMIETMYLAAKAKSAPNLREKILADIKGGTGQPSGGPSPEDKRTEDDKIIDGIVDQAEKDRGKIT